MKKNILLTSLLVPGVLSVAGLVAISCSKNDLQNSNPSNPDPNPTPKPDPEPNPDPNPTPKPDPEPTPKPDPEPNPNPNPQPEQQKKVTMPLNFYMEDGEQGSKIFDEEKWRQITSFDQVTTEFIKSTIINSDKYEVEIREDASNKDKWITKNGNLVFISFLYRYKAKNVSQDQLQRKNWFVQTIYYDLSKDITLSQLSITLDEYWKLAEEKASSNSQGPSEYKNSFFASLFNKNTNPSEGNYTNMQQANMDLITLANHIAKDKFDKLNREYNNITIKLSGGMDTMYSNSSDYLWQSTFQTTEGNKIIELGQIQYLAKNAEIFRVFKNDSSYIKFKFPKNSIKVTINNEEFYNEFENEFYINTTKWGI